MCRQLGKERNSSSSLKQRDLKCILASFGSYCAYEGWEYNVEKSNVVALTRGYERKKKDRRKANINTEEVRIKYLRIFSQNLLWKNQI